MDLGLPLWVRGGKTPIENMFSELPQIPDILGSAVSGPSGTVFRQDVIRD
jgi:hypothetical protein